MEETADPKIIERLEGQSPTPEDLAGEQEQQDPEGQDTEVREETPKDRTGEQFNKLTNSNKELNLTNQQLQKENEELKRAQAEAKYFADSGWNPQENIAPQIPIIPQVPAYNPTQFPGLTPTQVSETKKQLFDENGYVDRQLLESSLQAAADEAKAAKQEALQTRLEMARRDKQREEEIRTQQVLRVQEEFPELNPNNTDGDRKFKPDYWDAVRDRMWSQKIKSGREDYYQAAKELYPVYNRDVKKAEKEQIEAKQNQLKNINAIKGTGTASQRITPEEQSALVDATRKGKKGALAERLRAIDS